MEVPQLIEISQTWPCVVSFCSDGTSRPKLVVAGSKVLEALVEDDFLRPDLEDDIIELTDTHFYDTKLEDLRREDIESDPPFSPISLLVMRGGLVNGYIRTPTMEWLNIFRENGWEARSTSALRYVRELFLGHRAESCAAVGSKDLGRGWSSPIICINDIGGKYFGVEGYDMDPEDIAPSGGVDLKPGNIDHVADSLPVIAAIGAINTLILEHWLSHSGDCS